MKWLLRALIRIASSLSLHSDLKLGCVLGWIYGSVISYHRKDALDALARAFPEKSERERRQILDRMYRNLGMNLLETMRFPSRTDEQLKALIRVEGEDIVKELLGRGKGLIFLSAHIGNWDLMCTIAPRFGYPLTIITKDIKNKAVNELWMDIRQRFGLRFVPAHNSYRQCLTALKKNELVGFILDQNMIRTEGVFVDFFGKPACTTPGLAYMSAQSGAPVVPVFTIREKDGCHLIKVLPPIEPPPDRKPETAHEYTQKYTKAIEDVVRQYPDQWIWIHRRWRTVPDPSSVPTAVSP